jgi:RNA polymerase sigma-70 factor (ECF subfamily)
LAVDLFGASSDSALVVAVARRHERALEELYRRHADSLFTLSRRVIRDDSLAADVVQEVFVRLWNAPERFDAERGKLRSFLLADTHGRSVDVVRAEQARRRREERDLVERMSQPAESTEDDAIAGLESAELRQALSALGSDERRPIELAYFGGLSYREVADVLGEPEGTVKSRIRAGLAKLRGTLVLVASLL